MKLLVKLIFGRNLPVTLKDHYWNSEIFLVENIKVFVPSTIKYTNFKVINALD